MAGSIALSRSCKFCKQTIRPWLRGVPEYCCDEYRDVIREVLDQAMEPAPPVPAKKKPKKKKARKKPVQDVIIG